MTHSHIYQDQASNWSIVITSLFALPILVGLASVLLPAFGYMPVIGFDTFNGSPWQALLDTPQLWQMLRLTLGTSIAATLVSLFISFGLISSIWGTSLWHKVQRWLSPMMAVPHVALAFGLSFVLMPSGFLARILAGPVGWESPPGWHIVQDSWGISYTLLLILKETPFLVFMMMSAVGQLPAEKTLKLGYSLGYQRWTIWQKLLWPCLYPIIRLPVYTVLAFSVSVVDIPLILGPTNPPLFSVQILQWLQDYDLAMQLQAAAGSILLMFLVMLIIGLFYLCEKVLKVVSRPWLMGGGRGYLGNFFEHLSVFSWRLSITLFSLSLLVLVIWSFVWRWRFPSLSPEWSLQGWERASVHLVEPVWNTLIIGSLSAISGVVLAVLLLELSRARSIYTKAVVYMPLLLPQMTFLFGIQILLLKLGIEGHWLTVTAIHLIFVLPYCYLSLVGPWQGYDQRQTIQAQILCGSRWKAFIKVKLQILWRPLMSSLALGFAVSVAQYLPTLLVSAGRIDTVTTEAVGLVSGGNRRLMGVHALVQMLLPMLCFALAILASHWSLKHGRLTRRLN